MRRSTLERLHRLSRSWAGVALAARGYVPTAADGERLVDELTEQATQASERGTIATIRAVVAGLRR